MHIKLPPFQSDTCGVEVPELELELEEGTLGGRFTTVEGMLTAIRDQLGNKNPFLTGDSSNSDTRTKLDTFLEKLDKVCSSNSTWIYTKK